MELITPPQSPREIKCPGAPKKKYQICKECGVRYNFMHYTGCNNSGFY